MLHFCILTRLFFRAFLGLAMIYTKAVQANCIITGDYEAQRKYRVLKHHIVTA